MKTSVLIRNVRLTDGSAPADLLVSGGVITAKAPAGTLLESAAEKTLEMARIELNRVMVERKTHEKLRERAFEEFKQEIAQAESKEIDELVSYNYHEG